MKRLNKMVYLAGPYTHRLARIRNSRYEELTRISSKLLSDGIINFSPITHSHNQQKYLSDFCTTFDYWRRNDLAFLSRCDEIWVSLIDGWDKSYGVDEEVKFAKANGIPVKYIHIDPLGDLIISESATKITGGALHV